MARITSHAADVDYPPTEWPESPRVASFFVQFGEMKRTTGLRDMAMSSP